MASSSLPRCFKCQDDVGIVGTRETHKKAYCRTCFLDNYHKNIRDAFFRQCRVPPNTPIILAVSGGFNSMAMMHSLGLLRVQNITRGGAGKIDFNMHVLHLCGEDDILGMIAKESTNENDCINDFLKAQSSTPVADGKSSFLSKTLVSACTSVAPLDHVPQATTTKRRVQEKKKNSNTAVNEFKSTNYTTPLFEPSRVHVKKMADYLPPYSEISKMFFGSNDGDTGSSSFNPVTSVSMAEDLLSQLRSKAIAKAAVDLTSEIYQKETQENSQASRKEGENSPKHPLEMPSSVIVLYGDSALRSSVEGLYQLVRGRGSAILDLSGYRGTLYANRHIDENITSVAVIARRPMRSALPKENLFYCRIEGISHTWSIVDTPNNFDTIDFSFLHPNQHQQTSIKIEQLRNASLLQFCIANACMHKELTRRLVQAVKKHHAGTTSAASITSHKAKSSIRELLETFLLNLSDSSYRSAIFNVLHSVDKMLNNSDQPQQLPNEDFSVGSQQQLRFGPKNAQAFAANSAEPPTSELPTSKVGFSMSGKVSHRLSLKYCSLCGGGNRDLEIRACSIRQDSKKFDVPSFFESFWCHSCCQILNPILSDSFIMEPNNKMEKNEMIYFLTQTIEPHHEKIISKMSQSEIIEEISEFLLDTDKN